MAFEAIRRNSFLVTGRAGMDLYADPPGTKAEDATSFFACLGGSAGNIAVGLCRLGCKASLVSAVSDDAVGRFVLNELKRFGVDATRVSSLGGEARTSLGVTETRIEDTQTTIYRNHAADLHIERGQLAPGDLDAAGALIVTGTALALDPSRGVTFGMMGEARAAGVPVVLDVDYRPYSWVSAADAASTYLRAAELSDIVIGNDDEFAVMANSRPAGADLAASLAAKEGRICIYKMGELGSVTHFAGRRFETGIFPVTAIKPMGAGDAFMAGLMAGLANGRDLEEAVRRGSAAAAIVVSRIGCAPAMPTESELDAFIAQNPQPEIQ